MEYCVNDVLGLCISIHALLAESDSANHAGQKSRSAFLSTLSLRRATRVRSDRKPACMISIHALLAESDCPVCQWRRSLKIFLSTLSLRRATPMPYPSRGRNRNFYPRSPCGERPLSRHPTDTAKIFLSTLSLRRATSSVSDSLQALKLFLSTLSLRRATVSFMLYDTSSLIFLSTLSLRRATLAARDDSIMFVFLSTLSLRRATSLGDLFQYPSTDFYPRSPCGERHNSWIIVMMNTLFLSTLSLRRATGQ